MRMFFPSLGAGAVAVVSVITGTLAAKRFVQWCAEHEVAAWCLGAVVLGVAVWWAVGDEDAEDVR